MEIKKSKQTKTRREKGKAEEKSQCLREEQIKGEKGRREKMV